MARASLNLIFFVLYLLFYGRFVYLNAFRPSVMDSTPLAGINLAVIYGFGLIIGAIVMALLYGLAGMRSVSGTSASVSPMDASRTDGSSGEGVGRR